MIPLRNQPASHVTSPLVILVVAVAAVALAAALLWVAVVSPRGVPGVDYYEVTAEFDDAANIAPLSDVRIAGRRVGQVSGIDWRRGRAAVRLQLDPDVARLRSDTTARIGLKGLLGAKFVDVSPGRHGRLLPDGATLPARRTSNSLELLDVAQALDVRRRRHLQSLVRGLGQGWAGRGESLNDMLRDAPPFLRHGRRLSSAVLAVEGSARRFVPALESAAAAYDPVREPLASGFRPQATVLRAFDARTSELQRTLEEAPRSLGALRRGMNAATPLLAETAGLARATTRFTKPAPAALRRTAALLRESRPALRETQPLLRRLAEAVPPSLAFLRRIDPVAEPAGRALGNSSPSLVEFASRPCELLTFARNWRSTLGFGVPPGSGDPTGDLDEGQGLGPLNSFRIVVTGEPAEKGASAYPPPCAAPKERVR